MKNKTAIAVISLFAFLTIFLATDATAEHKLSFKDVDSNKDGSVSLEEMTNAKVKSLKKRFKKLDKNKDGVLSAEEYEGSEGQYGNKDASKKQSHEKKDCNKKDCDKKDCSKKQCDRR